jgi:hypothetical protein
MHILLKNIYEKKKTKHAKVQLTSGPAISEKEERFN